MDQHCFSRASRWSLAGLWLGALLFVSGIATVGQSRPDPSENMHLGSVMVLGAWAYRSAKRRKVGLVPRDWPRLALELGAMLLIVAATALRNDALNFIYTHPWPGVLVPLWAWIAYAVVTVRGRAPSPRRGAA